MENARNGPDELLPHLSFTLLDFPALSSATRLGKLDHVGRASQHTPHYLGLSSRGCVPHLTPDMMRNETAIKSIYTAFEDYSEHLPDPPPVFEIPCPPADSPLRRFICLQQDALLILGPRRIPMIRNATPNTATSMNICTSVGYRNLGITSYIEAVSKIRPDVVVAPVDFEVWTGAPSRNRQEKMVERSTAWIRGLQAGIERAKLEGTREPAVWAPVLPIEAEMQNTYLEHLEETGSLGLNGIVLYDDKSVLNVPPSLRSLPLICFAQPRSPHHILISITLGVDLFALPFITTASDAGIAFVFKFPAPSKITGKLPLGLDMWAPMYATDLAPLQENCSCYTCCNHHRAYIRHLLSAKEMLAWVLLQIHNHHVMDEFFKGIRESIAHGNFEVFLQEFTSAYADDFPEFKGQGPRIRGYQSSGGPEPKKLNKPPFGKLQQDMKPKGQEVAENRANTMNDQKNRKAETFEAEILSSNADGQDLEDIGFAQLYE